MVGKQANLIDKRDRIPKLFSCGCILSTLAARDSAFCSNLANVLEIGHLGDHLNEMETHWMENINETISHPMIKRVAHSYGKKKSTR